MAFSKKAINALSQEYSIPGHQSYQTNQQITSQYGGGGDGAPLVVVASLPAGTTVTSPGVTAALGQVTTRVEQAVPGSRVASYATTNDSGFVSRDGRTTFIIDYPPPEPGQYGRSPLAVQAVQTAIKGETVGGAPVTLTGYDALTAQAGSSKGASVLVESLLGGFGALIVLAFVFASFLALVPLVIALVSIMTSFLAVWGLAEATSVSSIVEFLIALVGLGIAIDYSLLIVVRWREARGRGLSGEDAVIEAMATAGRAVVFSGTAVGVGLLCLIVLPVPFLRSLGYGGLLIPIVSVAVTLTLLPVLLATIGPRLDWPHRRADAKPARAWIRWSGFVVKHRWASAIVALAIMGALAGAATTLTLGPADGNPDTLSQTGTAKATLNTLKQSGIGEGTLTPIEILAPRADGPGLVHALSGLAGVQGATAPTAASWARGGTAIVDVFTRDNSPSTLASVRDTAHSFGPNVTVGGIDAQNRDFISAVYGSFPLMIALIAILGYILLARAFRSLLLPLKAVALNVLSVAASWGALTLVWQKGYGSHALWGIPALGSIPSWLPVIVFAFLFGLSMDYEVFILSRIREEHDRGASNHDAILAGMGRTGRLVTSAALILFLGFVAMSTASGPVIKAMATGFGAGIIVDATVVRALLVPALMSIFGDWSWRFPRVAAKVLFVPGPRGPVEADPEYDPVGRPAS